jgi:hypothetical protein
MNLMELGGSVAWAGPAPAPRWLDMAREYTERWVHQEQIREAVGTEGLRDKQLFHPVLDTFVHALPHTYRAVTATEGTHVRIAVTGSGGGDWSLVMHSGQWGLFVDVETEALSVVTLDSDTAWRLFTKGIGVAELAPRVTIQGDQSLGEVALKAVAMIV